MPNTVINPNTVMVHFQNTSLAHTAMVCAWGLIVATFLAISQITTLALDLVDGGLGALDVGQEGGRHPAGVPGDGGGVGGEAGGGEGREGGGVGDPGGRGEAEPAGDGDEDRGVVDVADRGEHREDGQRQVPRPPHRRGAGSRLLRARAPARLARVPAGGGGGRRAS